MKKIFFLILTFIFFTSILIADTQRTITQNQSEIKDNKIYVINEKEPFTGLIRKYYEDGITIKAEYKVVKGLIDGTASFYYRNGKLEAEYHYVDNKLHGFARYYSKNGELYAIEEFNNGNIVERFRNENIVEENEKINSSKKSELLFKSSLILLFILLILASLLKIFRALPSFKILNDYQKELILKKFLKYNNSNKKSLHSAYRINGFGTGFYKIGSLEINNQKFNIYAKMPSALFIPLPFIFGYVVCYGKKEIISTISKEDFKILKREIEEDMLIDIN